MLESRRSTPDGTPWGVVSLSENPLNIPIDPNGNLTSKTQGTDTWTYNWNALNQLVRVTKDTGQGPAEVARFAYDPLGRRVEKIVRDVTTNFTYDAEDILRETRSGTTSTYVHGLGIDEPVSMESGVSIAYHHADGLGSITKLTDSAGSILQTRQYDAWGNPEVGEDQSGYAFTGREWDPEVEMYYYRARYYGAETARFVSEDLFDHNASLNAYVYVNNLPVLLVDPLGLYVMAPPVHKTSPAARECFYMCLDSYFFDNWFHTTGSAAGVAGLAGSVNIVRTGPKPAGTIPGTSLLSKCLRKIPLKIPGGAPAPTLLNPGARTTSAGAFAARWTFPIAAASVATDVVAVGYCDYVCSKNFPCECE